MGLLKNYLLTVLHQCSDQTFGQDAVEWAVCTGRVELTGNLQADLRTIMGEPGRPETGQYDAIVSDYQRHCAEVLGDDGAIILEELLRPVECELVKT